MFSVKSPASILRRWTGSAFDLRVGLYAVDVFEADVWRIGAPVSSKVAGRGRCNRWNRPVLASSSVEEIGH